MKKYLLTLAAMAGMMAPAGAVDRVTHDPNAVNTETILHVWSWNFPTITAHMQQIADAGYTMIQTSPVQTCFNPQGTSKRIFGQRPDGVYEGWFFYYQPLDWKVGNHIVGTKDEMQVMLDEAKKNG